MVCLFVGVAVKMIVVVALEILVVVVVVLEMVVVVVVVEGQITLRKLCTCPGVALLSLVCLGDLLLEGRDGGVLGVLLVVGQQLLWSVEINLVPAVESTALHLDISLGDEGISAPHTHAHHGSANDGHKRDDLRVALEDLHGERDGTGL